MYLSVVNSISVRNLSPLIMSADDVLGSSNLCHSRIPCLTGLAASLWHWGQSPILGETPLRPPAQEQLKTAGAVPCPSRPFPLPPAVGPRVTLSRPWGTTTGGFLRAAWDSGSLTCLSFQIQSFHLVNKFIKEKSHRWRDRSQLIWAITGAPGSEREPRGVDDRGSGWGPGSRSNYSPS